MKGLDKLFNGCGFEHKIKDTPKKAPSKKPKDSTIKKVVDFVARTPNCNRKKMLDGVGLSSYGLDGCVEFLVKAGRLNKEFIGMSGSKQKNIYTLNNEQN